MSNAKIDTKNAVKEINNLIEQFNSLIKATGDVSTVSKANFRKVETALQGLQKVTNQSNASFDRLNAAQKQASLAANAEAAALRRTTAELNRTTQATNQTAAAQDRLEKNTKKTTSTFGGLLSGLKSLIGAFGVVIGLQLFGSIIKNAYELTKQFNSLAFSLEKITKDSFDTAVSQRFLLEITEAFGVKLTDTAERWVKFLAAAKQSGVTLKDTEDIFRAVTKAGAVLALKTDDLKSVYLALEQMMSKGKITTEELRRQLGERLPGAVGIMAAAVGVNVNQLDAMLKKGELLSAEVLPKFARALELAYGIQTLERVDNIESAQNRLTNAWEKFIMSITEGNVFIEAALNWLAEKLNSIASIFLTEEQSMQLEIIKNKKDFESQIFEIAKKRLDKGLAAGKKYSDLELKIEEDREAIIRAKDQNLSKDKQKALEDSLAKNTQIMIGYSDEIIKIEKDIANKNIEGVRLKYDKYKAIIAKAQKEIRELESLDLDTSIERGKITKARKQLEFLEAQLEVYRKLKEESKVSTFKPDGKTGRKPSVFEIKPVNNLENEIAKSRLMLQKELNDELLAGDKASYAERQAAAMNNVGVELSIADAAYKEEIEKATTYYIKMLDDLEDAELKGSIIEGDEAQFRLDLQKNYTDATILATENKNKKVINVEQKFANEQVKIAKWAVDKNIDILEDGYNLEIIAAKEVYENSKKTAKDKKDLEEVLTRISVEQANARIDILIKEYEAQKIMYEEFPEKVAEIERLINRLNAARQSFDPSDKAQELKDKVGEILSVISDMANAIGDLGNAIFDRKIENINAEINAEQEKYDKLISLAKGNKDEQIRLETEKENKTKALEAKRLKEEQKKAKFNKANAILQIALNTAMAIVKLPADGGLLGLAAVPIIVALGAIQMAAALAAPIPKYKDGLKGAKSDHVGMINDGGRQEFIERDGNILTTSTKNAIVNLKKGDTIHKSYDDMVGGDIFSNLSRSILLNGLSSKNKSNNEVGFLEKVFDKNLKTLNKDLKEGIRDGFKNVNIHNHTSYNSDWIRYKNDTL